jgi:transposase
MEMVHTMKDQTRGSTRTRRQHEREFKDDLIAQSLVPGASVAAIAMKGGINANLLFKWRRKHLRAKVETAPTAANLLPVCVIQDVDPMPTSQPIAPVGPAVSRNARPCVIEVEIAGAQLRLRGAVDETMLSSVLRALRQSA